MPLPGVARARRVLGHADARAANPFESALRAIVLETGLRGFVPQLVVAEDGLFACVDLGDPDRRVALEADGYTVHGDRRAFAVDLARHDELQTARVGHPAVRVRARATDDRPGWPSRWSRQPVSGSSTHHAGTRQAALGALQRPEALPCARMVTETRVAEAGRTTADPQQLQAYSRTVAKAPCRMNPTRS